MALSYSVPAQRAVLFVDSEEVDRHGFALANPAWLAVGETVTLLHPCLPLVGVSIVDGEGMSAK